MRPLELRNGLQPRIRSRARWLSPCLLSVTLACGASTIGGRADDDPALVDDDDVPPDPIDDVDPTLTGPTPSPGSRLFVESQVLDIRVTLSAADQEALEQRGNDERYVPAQAIVSGTTIAEVQFAEIGIRHKGAYSLHHCWDEFGGVRSREGSCAKLSYKLKFDKYDDGARLDGLKRLNLHSSSGDATRLHELLSYDAFRAFGVDAPRTAVARVHVNDVLEGLFIVVESVDGRYTKAHYPDGGGDGNLYKEIWPTPGVPAAEFEGALRTNEAIGDVSAFVDFAGAVADSTAESFDEDMERWVDVEELLRYVAVDRATKNWDGIMAFYSPTTPHNFFWYHDAEGSERFHLVPWDLDNTLWDFDPYMEPQLWVTAAPIPDWNQEPLSCAARPVWDMTSGTRVTPPRCDTFLDQLAETHWARFSELGRDLLDTTFGAPRMQERVQHFAGLLEPIIAEDPYLDLGQWRWERDRMLQTLARANADFRAFVEGGLITEPDPVPPSSDRGLDVAIVNDFEAGAAAGQAPRGVYVYGDDSSSFSAGFNFEDPLAGDADLRFDFELVRQPGPFNEWVNLGFATRDAAEMDLVDRERVVLRLSSDRDRNVRIRLASPAYDDRFGGAWSEFGTDVGVSTTPTTVSLPLSEFRYPDWARDAWTDGQGWQTSDDEALAIVRSRFNGLIVAPAGSFDAQGELRSDREVGYLQIDDIRIE